MCVLIQLTVCVDKYLGTNLLAQVNINNTLNHTKHLIKTKENSLCIKKYFKLTLHK